MKGIRKKRKPMSKRTKTLLLMTLPALILFVLFNTTAQIIATARKITRPTGKPLQLMIFLYQPSAADD